MRCGNLACGRIQEQLQFWQPDTLCKQGGGRCPLWGLGVGDETRRRMRHVGCCSTVTLHLAVQHHALHGGLPEAL